MSFWTRLGAMAAMAGRDTPPGVVDGMAKVMDNMDAGDYARVVQSAFKDYGTAKQTLGYAAQPAVGAFGQAIDALPQGVKDKGNAALYGLGYLHDKVSRAASTVNIVGQQAEENPDDWTAFQGQSWQDAWEMSKNASVGQTTVNSVMGSFEYDEIGSQQWQTYYHDTPAGQISSGAIDFVGNLFLDPLNYVGAGFIGKVAKVGKAATGLERGIDATTSAAVFGEETADGLTGAAKAQRDLVDGFLAKTDDMSVAQLAETDMFKQSSDAGALAYAFGRANEITDLAAKATAKRDILGATFGDAGSLERLRASNGTLASELEDMMGEIQDLDYAARMTDPNLPWDQVISEGNKPDKLKHVEAKAADIEAALENFKRVESLAYGDALSTLKKGSVGQAWRQSKIAATIDGGKVIGPIHVITGKRLPGTFKGDADDAIDIFRDTLFRSKTLAPEAKSDLLNRFVGGDARTRVNIAHEADAAMFEAAATRFAPGADREAVQALLSQVKGRRGAYIDNLKARAYSAGDDVKFIPLRDEEGVAFAVDRPLLSSQLSDDISMMDPKQIESALREVTDIAGGGWGGLMAQTRRNGRLAWEMTDAGLSTFNRMWKFSALFRAAYPVRVQADSQMRLMASLGAMQYMALGIEGGTNLLKSSRLLAPEDWRKLITNPRKGVVEAFQNRSAGTDRIGVTREGTDGVQYKGQDINPARNADEQRIMADALAENTQTKDIIMDRAGNDLRGMRATGNFAPTPGSDPRWSDNMLRALNQQYRNDPVVGQILAGLDDDAIVNWLLRESSGRAHWKDFKSIYGDPELLVGRVRKNVDDLIPEGSALRGTLVDRQLTDADLKSQWPDWRERPAVHGELLEREGYKGLIDRVDNLAATWYKFASDMPEQVMARHPFYTVKFREHMKAGIDRIESLDGWVDPAKVEEARLNASKLARRDMGKVLYDVTRRSNIAQAMRYASPFYSAWADTMQKWSRLIGANPSTLAFAEKAFGAPNNAGWVQDDEGNVIDGQGRIISHETGEVIGQAGFLDGNINIPMPKVIAEKYGWAQARVRKGSFNIVFQGDPFWLPGPGVMVSAPASEMFVKVFPEAYEDSTIANFLLPYGTSDSVPDSVAPGWIKAAYDARGSIPWLGKHLGAEKGKDFAGTYVQLYSELVQKNRVEGLGLTDEQIAEKAQTQTRNSLLLKAISSNVAPVSVQPRSRLAFYKDEFNRYSKKFGADAQAKFYEDYPEFYEMGISLSSNTTGLNATDESWEAVQSYRADIAQSPEFGWMYAGAANLGGTHSDAVYDAQMQQSIGPGTNKTFRSVQDPMDAAKKVQVNKGWTEYTQMSTAIQLAMEARGVSSLNSKAASDLAVMKKAFTAKLMENNPTWADEFGKRDADKVGRFFRQADEAVAKHPELKDRPDFKALAEYREGRELFRTLLAQRDSKDIENPNNADLLAMWDAYKTKLIQSDMGFEQMSTRILDKDDLSK